jgi:hypothetical protein
MEKSFIYPLYIRVMGIVLIVLSVVLAVLIIIAASTSQSYGLVGLSVLFGAVFSALGWRMVRNHSVVVTLTEEGITLTDWKRRRFVPYGQIQGSTNKTIAFSALVLNTAQGRLTVRKTLVGYPDFVAALKDRAVALRSPDNEALQVHCRAWELYISAGIFLLLCLGFMAAASAAALAGEIGAGICVIIAAVLLPFVIGLLVAILRTPRSFVFMADGIKKNSLAGSKFFKAADIRNAEYGQKKPRTRSRFGSLVVHFISLRFADTQKAYIWIDQTMTDFPIEDIREYIRKCYPVKDCWTETTMNQPPQS